MEEYVSKNKIRAKIDELKEIRDIAKERKMMASVESFEITIQHLQELLEEEK